MSNSMKDKTDLAGSVLELIGKTPSAWVVLLSFGGGAVTYLSTLPEWAKLTCYSSCSMLLVAGIVYVLMRRRYIALGEAVEIAYNALPGSWIVKRSDASATEKSPVAISKQMAYNVLNLIDLHAAQPPAKALQVIKSTRVMTGIFNDTLTELSSSNGRSHKLTDLKVNRQQFGLMLKQLKIELELKNRRAQKLAV